MIKRWGWSLPILTFLLCFSGVVRLNLSESLPFTLFLSSSLKQPLEAGQIVLFEHPGLQAMLGKIIVGLPGDKIILRDRTLYVNEIEIGQVESVSKSGKQYQPLLENIIPVGSYFVYTDHPESFDSRYAEFGLVKEEWIKGVLWPLF